MIRSATRIGLILISTTLMACGGQEPAATSIGIAAPASGTITMANPDKTRLISGLIFRNEGTGQIDVSGLATTLSSGDVLEMQGGLGVEPGSSVTYLFDAAQLQSVASISFSVQGSTEALEVLDTDETGTVP